MVRNQQYPTSEHAYISLKGAYINAPEEILKQIEKEENPKNVYYNGKNMGNSADWEEDCVKLIEECLIAKYKGCDGYRKYLLNHTGYKFREDTKHPIYRGKHGYLNKLGDLHASIRDIPPLVPLTSSQPQQAP